jgi:hypothetical protein
MKHTAKYAILAILLMVCGCAREAENTAEDMLAFEQVATGKAGQNDVETVERKLIKTGNVVFETDNFPRTRQVIFEAAGKYQGYVATDQEYNTPGGRRNTVIIRMPAENFDKLLSEATHDVAQFEQKDIDVSDVTEEFLDIQARLKTKKELEQRYLELLKQAKNVTELLEIEREIGALRADIESVEGRLKYLQDRVAFATLTLTFYERIREETEFGRQFREGFRSGWENLVGFVVLLTHVWPFLLLALAGWAGFRLFKRKKQ